MQQCTTRGLVPAPDVGRRCTVKPILNANSTIVEGLIGIWTGKTPRKLTRCSRRQT